MKDGDCVHFLQWALPRLRMRWPGFRKVRRQVCKRLARRIAELALPDGPFDLILCRNLVFTYYDEELQRQLLDQLLVRLRPGGWLVLGAREQLPEKPVDMQPLSEQPGLYRRS